MGDGGCEEAALGRAVGYYHSYFCYYVKNKFNINISISIIMLVKFFINLIHKHMKPIHYGK